MNPPVALTMPPLESRGRECSRITLTRRQAHQILERIDAGWTSSMSVIVQFPRQNTPEAG